MGIIQMAKTAAVSEANPGRSIGPAVLWVMVLATLLVAIYYEILFRLSVQWYVDPDYSHGFLIPFLSAYFVWERRTRLARITPRPSWWGVSVMLLGLLMLGIGQVGAELFLQRTSLVVVLAGLVLLVLGRETLTVLSFPIAFLLFMVPLPAIVVNAIAFPLQGFAAQTATYCLMALDIPVLREGNVITLAKTSLEVAEACSGIRSLLSLLALGTVYAYFAEGVRWKRWVIVAASVPVAILANAFRVAGTGILAHYFGVEVAQGFYHDFSGWLVFAAAFILLVGIGTVLGQIGGREQPA
jgi:exosortase